MKRFRERNRFHSKSNSVTLTEAFEMMPSYDGISASQYIVAKRIMIGLERAEGVAMIKMADNLVKKYEHHAPKEWLEEIRHFLM